MDDLDQKRCSECSSPIAGTAKRCPFCNSPQAKNWKRKYVLLFTVPQLLLFGSLFFFARIPSRSNYHWVDYAQQVHVSSSELHFEVEEGRRLATLIGVIRNDSGIAWEQPRIEVQYFNKEGKLIDTVTKSDSELSLPPHAEHAFRVQCTALRPSADYASHKVILRYADDAARYARPKFF